MFGAKFKELRTAQKISLKEAAEAVVNPSSLSRWENGQTELKFETVIELLENIHISPLEFLSVTFLELRIPLIDEIDKAINNPLELKRIAIKYLTIYKHNPTTTNLLDAATACNFYLDISKKDLFPAEYKNRLEDIFANTMYWSQYYVLAFGNTVTLLNSKTIYGFANVILNNLEEYKKSGFENFLDTFRAVLNAYQILIERGNIEKAKKLQSKLDSVHLSAFSIYISIQRDFFDALLDYRITRNSTSIISIINSLKKLKQYELVQEFTTEFNKIKSLK